MGGTLRKSDEEIVLSDERYTKSYRNIIAYARGCSRIVSHCDTVQDT